MPEGRARIDMFEAKRNAEIKAYTDGLSSYEKQLMKLQIPASQNAQLYNDFLRRINTATTEREFFEIAQDLERSRCLRLDHSVPANGTDQHDEVQSKAKDKAVLNTYNTIKR